VTREEKSALFDILRKQLRQPRQFSSGNHPLLVARLGREHFVRCSARFAEVAQRLECVNLFKHELEHELVFKQHVAVECGILICFFEAQMEKTF